MHSRPVEVLLVEDSPADAQLTRTALLEGAVSKRLHVVVNGADAIDFLRRRHGYERAPRPDVVLLDLNLPKMGGLEVLREIKSDPSLRAITVIVLTTSQMMEDVRSAYDLAANCYVVKPVDLDEFFHAIAGIEEFWMRVATLPTIGRDPLGTSESEEKPSEPKSTQKGSANARRRHQKIAAVRRRVVGLIARAGSTRNAAR